MALGVTGGLVLTLNAGSSSLKFATFQADGTPALRGAVSPLGDKARLRAADTDAAWPHGVEAAGLRRLLDWVDEHEDDAEIAAIGHRVVHGGDRAGPARIDDALLAQMEALTPLAPLHQPHNLAAMRAVAAARPGLPQVACFDTSFHRTMGPLAESLPLPREYRDAGARRYGFHGLSYDYIARRLAAVAPDLAQGRVVVAHLGSGASLCAMQGGRSVDTTMGMTALDGIMMATRPGRLDPGAVLWLAQARGLATEAIEDLLYHHAGLLGVSGSNADIRELVDDAAEDSRLAVAMFTRAIVREAGALAAMLGGVDGFVFTGGIGEHQASVRRDVGAGLGFLGLDVDGGANGSYRPDRGPAPIGPRVWVIPTDEESLIATLTRGILAEHGT